jgi:hypothetical protein
MAADRGRGGRRRSEGLEHPTFGFLNSPFGSRIAACLFVLRDSLLAVSPSSKEANGPRHDASKRAEPWGREGSARA